MMNNWMKPKVGVILIHVQSEFNQGRRKQKRNFTGQQHDFAKRPSGCSKVQSTAANPNEWQP